MDQKALFILISDNTFITLKRELKLKFVYSVLKVQNIYNSERRYFFTAYLV